MSALSVFVVAVIAAEPDRIRVIVSIQPQAYFVERVGGRAVEIVTLISPYQSPAVFDPTPKQVTEIQHADLYFTAGVPFENGLLPKIVAQWPELSVVDLSLNRGHPASRTASSESHADHTHDHVGDAPHVWLDPMKVKQMARIICEHLIKADPTQASAFRKNLDLFVRDLDSVDTEIRWRLATVKRRTFFVYHPAYGQFAQAYGLTQVPIEIDGKEPGARRLAAFIEQAKKDSVRAVFVQPQFSGKSAATIAEAVGAKLIEMDPLAYDYLRNLRSMTNNLVHALGGDRFQNDDEFDGGQR
jgi:zinc transport system substrate-binding protein